MKKKNEGKNNKLGQNELNFNDMRRESLSM